MRAILFFYLLIIILPSSLRCVENQVIVKKLDWRISSTEHFDIYYYQDSQSLLPFVGPLLEKVYKSEASYLNPNLKKRIPFFLFASINDMQQNTIADVSDGVGGLTEPLKDRFMVWSDGSKQWLEDVIYHEFAHEIQFSVMVDGFWKSARILKTYVYPLWMMEGISEYATGEKDIAVEELYVRDSVLDGKLPHLYHLHGFGHLKPHQTTLAYKTGAAAIRFLVSEYGRDKPALMMQYYKSRYDINSVLQPLIGLDIWAFDSKFRRYQEMKYSIEKEEENLKEAEEKFRLTSQKDDIPDFNLSPVFSAKRGILAYLSTLKGHPPALVLQNMASGEKKVLDYSRLGIENITYARFTRPMRFLSISPSERYLAFSAQKNHVEYFCVYDMEKDSFSKIPMNGFTEARQFAFSPDEKKVAFIGMKKSFNDVYEMPFNPALGLPDTSSVRNITSDEKDQSSPVWLADGSLIYSQEEGQNGIYRRTLVLFREDRAFVTLLDFNGSVYDASPGPDGIYFTAEYEKNFSLFRLDMAARKIKRLFRPVGGIFTPYVSGGEIYFSLFRHGCVNIYRYPIETLPEEELALATPGADYASTEDVVQLKEKKISFNPSLDLFYPAFMFSSPGGLFLVNYSRISDMLGRHTLTLYVNYNSGWPYFNSDISYLYSRYRAKYFLQSSFYSVDSLENSDDWKYDRRYVRNVAGLAYPFDRYRRGELYLIAKDNSKEYYYPFKFTEKTRSRAVQLSYVKDDINGLYLSAVYGSRLTLSWQKGFLAAGGDQKYEVYEGEYLKYLPMGRKSPFINRFYAGFSSGRDRKSFDFGGVNGLRGYARGGIENENSRVLNYNAEARFFLKKMDYHMWYFFPDFYFKALYIKLFSDNAYGWDYKRQVSDFSLKDIKNSVGFGVDFHTFILQSFQMVLSLDYAVRTDDGGRIFYFYLGPLF